ncbi:E3 ubiquitin-protein ligase SH3RF2 isoform X1 [Labeo rohita]|uniref:E3 ubiquitin-protein ligase SH3RF2 isoform X1 n=1 Tax=Labeo rohita TaxID=84645 RepID=UPI0021E1D9A8|nr:E3 ubiquitin-protein ligase SH3RF2 isoform X1 [Labeo rohita]XP_050983890.1 E3 ubiquitin-protein ligase SH3RF2 isoform X2 [Labeo rohita]XP_050983891.1 E3 ubiquitin-protein ligase SH3RF2 isoform X3 [Labeo rohita]XP_050983892.1 E3 ubiquitin-protein ligase SH3RF2 isoform X1 [Labeo rohita]XP_050983893.1 E3 ubiquitin-protein ligase SH3RF2 isoform X1 [Labeo rohita]
MEDVAVLNLLECSLCMEPLDVSAKVLPCQHTFCKACLQQHEASHPHQMCCPECRAAVPGSVEELPTNSLLLRLLESLQERGPLGTPRDRSVRYVSSTVQEDLLSCYVQDLSKPEQNTQGVQAQAVYDFQGNAPGELTMKSGDIIYLRWRVDDNWYYGEGKDSSGLVPVDVVRVISEQPQPLAVCRALYDFNANNLDPGDSKECLTFFKGDSITLIKQVNENWVEGKLGDKVGIFPLQLTEPNPAAYELLEKRKRRDSVESHPRSGGGVNADACVPRRIAGASHKSARPPNVSLLNSLNHPPLSQSQQPPHISSSAQPSSGKTPQLATFNKPRLRSSRRNLPKRDRTMNGESPPAITMALINPQASPLPSESKMSATQQLSISVCAALYSYTPHRSEELELRKGEMVGVYGKFKEGWLRGLSLRTGKVGILPANYVTPVLRTSARFLEQTRPAIPNTSTVSAKRHTLHKPQAVVLALDRVNGDTPSATMAVMSSAGPGRATQLGGKQGWSSVRRTLHATHRGLPNHGNYNSNSIVNLQPPPQDLGQIYTFGRSPVLPKKRNGLFSNPIKAQHWAYETTAPSAGGYQTISRDPVQKEAAVAPQSILVKPDSHKHNTEKPVKSVRFLTQDAPQTPKMTSPGQVSGSQPGLLTLEHWNPSAILGRDGSTLVLKDTKTPRKSTGLDQSMDCLSLNMKPVLINNQPGSNRYRVMKSFTAKTDAELTLTEGEIVVVQRPRADGRLFVTQEISGKTGLFNSSVLEILDKVL